MHASALRQEDSTDARPPACRTRHIYALKVDQAITGVHRQMTEGEAAELNKALMKAYAQSIDTGAPTTTSPSRWCLLEK